SRGTTRGAWLLLSRLAARRGAAAVPHEVPDLPPEGGGALLAPDPRRARGPPAPVRHPPTAPRDQPPRAREQALRPVAEPGGGPVGLEDEELERPVEPPGPPRRPAPRPGRRPAIGDLAPPPLEDLQVPAPLEMRRPAQQRLAPGGAS